MKHSGQTLENVQTSRDKNHRSFDQNVWQYDYDALVLGDWSTDILLSFTSFVKNLNLFLLSPRERNVPLEKEKKKVPVHYAVHGATASIGVTGVCDSSYGL